MTPDLAITPDDVASDLDASRAADERIAGFFAQADAVLPPRTRSATRAAAPPPGAGRGLVARCPLDTIKRYHTLLHFEAAASDADDFGFLIAPACAVLEGELRRLLADPARPHSAELLGLSGSRAVLDDWRNGAPPTLGVLVALLDAVRAGLERQHPVVLGFVAGRFRPAFMDVLRDHRLSACLNRIRRDYRNPACHAERIFDAAAYERFSRLLVAAPRLGDWDRGGPDAPPAADAGVLHHHLASVR